MKGKTEMKFKSIRDTYKINTLLLTMALMYPNPKYDEKRKKIIMCVFVSIIPAITILVNDMHLRILRNDMPNLVRQSIISVSLIFVLGKLIITILLKKELRGLFDNIDNDYKSFNYLPEEYQHMVEGTIQKTKKIEKVWFIIMSITASSFPVLAGLCTIYSQFFSENPKRFMVHETAVIFFTEEQKYESPYFEIINLYITYIVVFLWMGFIGFDGMFTVCMLHVSLKLKIYNLNLKNSLNNVGDTLTIKGNIAAFVNNHCDVERFICEIQKCFEVWLVGIFFNAILQLGMTLTQVTIKTETDIKQMYYMFALATLVHIYLPCYLAAEVTSNASEIATSAYTGPWERIPDMEIRRSVCIIIAKAQKPICLNALGIITFNMELFVSILQTAYSMYTILRK